MSFKKEENKYVNLTTNDDRSTIDDSKFNQRSSSYEKVTELITFKDNPEKAEDKLLFGDTLQDLPIEKEKPITIDYLSLNHNRKGNMYMFWYDENDSPRICIGPHCILNSLSYILLGPFTLCLSTFIFGIWALYIIGLWNLLHISIKCIGFLVMFGYFGVYFTTFLINPGLPPKEDRLENLKDQSLRNYRICNICKIIQRPEDHTAHCEECNVCVLEMDHHCPWVSKCVGKNNLAYFNLFLLFTLLFFVYMVAGAFTIRHKLDTRSK